jgi:hypothetical protein
MKSPSRDSPTPKQFALLHVARRELGLGDDDWRALLARVAGVVSSADLDALGFETILAELKRLGFVPTTPRRQFGRRPGFATPAQLALMRKLWADWHGPDENEAALNAWLERFHHVSAMRFVTLQKANAVLYALKSMAGRRRSD